MSARSQSKVPHLAWPAVAILAMALGLVAPRRALAEEPETPQYRALLNEAVSEYDARRYEEARALFRRANDLSPNARTLRGVGMASFELREYVEALRALEGALADTRRPLTPTQHQQVEGLLERTRSFVGHFTLHLVPKQTTLHVDGAPAELESDGTLLLSFGRHAVTAEAAGSLMESRELNVIGGEREDLTFHLRPVAATLEPPAGAVAVHINPPLPSPGGPADKGTEPAHSATGWLVGAGVLAAGAAAGAIWWLQRNSEISRCQAAPETGSVCDNGDTLSSQRRVAIGLTAGAGVGAIALGTIGLVVHSQNHKPESGPILACSPGAGSVRCAFRISF
jgi:hypothetical protein